jgi:hypothetical protein
MGVSQSGRGCSVLKKQGLLHEACVQQLGENIWTSPNLCAIFLAAGPVGSTGYCGGQCCTGDCKYDSGTGEYYCCELQQQSTDEQPP